MKKVPRPPSAIEQHESTGSTDAADHRLDQVDKARVNEVAEDLRGTCKSLEDFATESECDNVPFLRELDDLVFCCAECGWWSDIGDLCEDTIEGVEDEQVCTECRPTTPGEDD